MTPEERIAELEEECARLRSHLALADRENEILRSSSGAVWSPIVTTRVQLTNERVRYLEHAVVKLEDVARDIASKGCYGYDCPDEHGRTCDPCWATRVLQEVSAWRYGGSVELPIHRHVGAMHDRTTNGWNPREEKIHRQWCRHVDSDRDLGLILRERPDPNQGTIFERSPETPSARDWYVATSVVQWLATNCGMSVLEGAGFKYTQWDEDSAALDARRAAAE